MANRSQHLSTKSGNKELTLQQHETDSPLLPVVQMQRLHEFRPDLVDSVVEETKKEAAFRREHQASIAKKVFVERMARVLGAIFIALTCIVAAYFISSINAYVAGLTISVGIGVLAAAFIKLNKES